MENRSTADYNFFVNLYRLPWLTHGYSEINRHLSTTVIVLACIHADFYQEFIHREERTSDLIQKAMAHGLIEVICRYCNDMLDEFNKTLTDKTLKRHCIFLRFPAYHCCAV
jgi:hypothetical protein